LKILCVEGVAGARQAGAAGGVAVIVDALRASVTIAAALSAGALSVAPVLSVENALEYLGRDGYLVAGERDGRKLDAFDLGNSPLEFLRRSTEVRGRRVVLTTSNGTRCVAASAGARAVLAGALPTATAVTRAARMIANQWNTDIYVVAAGWAGEPADEDRLASEVIAARIEGQALAGELDYPARFAQAEAGRRLHGLGYAEDVAYCARVDTLDLAPVLSDAGFVR